MRKSHITTTSIFTSGAKIRGNLKGAWGIELQFLAFNQDQFLREQLPQRRHPWFHGILAFKLNMLIVQDVRYLFLVYPARILYGKKVIKKISCCPWQKYYLEYCRQSSPDPWEVNLYIVLFLSSSKIFSGAFLQKCIYTPFLERRKKAWGYHKICEITWPRGVTVAVSKLFANSILNTFLVPSRPETFTSLTGSPSES